MIPESLQGYKRISLKVEITMSTDNLFFFFFFFGQTWWSPPLTFTLNKVVISQIGEKSQCQCPWMAELPLSSETLASILWVRNPVIKIYYSFFFFTSAGENVFFRNIFQLKIFFQDEIWIIACNCSFKRPGGSFCSLGKRRNFWTCFSA